MPRVILSIIYGVYYLFLLIHLFSYRGLSEQDEWLIYLCGWLSVPVFSLATTLIIEWLREKFLKESQNFYPLLLLVNSLYLFICVIVLRFSSSPFQYCDSAHCVLNLLDAQVPDWETSQFLVKRVPSVVVGTLIMLFPISHIVVLGLIKQVDAFSHCHPEHVKGIERVSTIGYGAAPIILGLTALNFSSAKIENSGPLVLAALCSFLFFFHKTIIQFRPGKNLSAVLNGVTFVLICLFVFDPSFSINRPHQNPYVDPVCDMRGGKSLLVDINSQYGVWATYFLKILFMAVPLSYSGLTLINMSLTILSYTVIYVLLRYVLESPLFAVISIFVIILVNFFATLGGEMVAYPSLGPLRFGLPYVLLLWTTVRLNYPPRRRYFRWLEGLTVAVASIWSFETFWYALAVYAAVLFYESCQDAGSFFECVQKIAGGIIRLLPLMVIVHLLFGLSIYARSGQLPHWNYYMDYIFLYSVGGWGGMPVGLWSPWLILVVIPLGALASLIFHLLSKDKQQPEPRLIIVAGLTALAIIQYTYFVGRSHVNNLFHVSVPVLCLAAYAFICSTRMNDQKLKWLTTPVMYCGYFALFFLVFSLTPRMVEKMRARLPQYSHISENFFKAPTTPQVSEALYLINKYAKDKLRLALFIEPDDTTETLLRSRKVHMYPFNYPVIVSICPAISERVLAFKAPLKHGDYLFLSKGASEFQQRIVKSIQGEFGFIVRETSPHGVYAIELGQK